VGPKGPPARGQYRKAVLRSNSHRCQLRLTDTATAGAPLASRLRLRNKSTGQRRLQQIETARDRPYGVFCDEDGSLAQFRRVGVGAVGLWPNHVVSCSKDMSNSSGKLSLVAGIGQRGILFDGPPSRALLPDDGGKPAVLKRVFIVE
jgi:hypothetical protein